MTGRASGLVIGATIAMSASIAYAAFGGLDLTPNGTAMFGPVGVGSSETQGFTLQNTTPTTTTTVFWSITGAGNAFQMVAPCTGTLCMSAAVPGTSSVPVQIKCEPQTAGTFNATLTVQSTIGGSSAGDTLDLTCNANGGGGGTIVISPTSHDFGMVDVGDTSPAFSFDVLNDTGIDPLTSISLFVSPGFELGSPCPGMSGCTVATPLPNNTSMLVEVKCKPTMPVGFTGMFTVNSASFSDVAGLNCQGIAGGSGAELALSTSSIAVSTRFGTSDSQTVVVTNEGDVDLTVSISPQGANAPHWMVSDCIPSCTIAPSDSRPVDFTYSASIVGDQSAPMTFMTNDPDDGEMTFSLNATGTGTGGILSVPSATLDFGQVRIGNTIARSFEVANTGIAAALPVNVSTSGAPFAIIPPTNASVAIADPATFNVTCQPGMVMTYNESVTVNAPMAFGPTSAMFDVVCEGVVTDVSIDPSSWDFGAVRLGASVVKDFTVTNVGAPMVTYLVPEVAPPFRAIAPTTGGTLLQNNSVTVTIAFEPTTEAAFQEDVTNLIQDEPTRLFNVTGTGGTPAYTVTPGSSVDLGTQCVGEVLTSEFVLDVTGTAPLRVEQPVVVGGGTAFRLDQVAPGPLPQDFAPGAAVDASVVATAELGEHTATLEWATDLAPADVTRVELSITGIDQGLAASPGSIDFGDVPAGQPATRPISIRVCVIDPVAVSATIEGDPAFTLLGPSNAVADRLASEPWTVEFRPTRRGDHHAILRLTPAAGPVVDIPLVGTNTDGEGGFTNYYACGCDGGTGGLGAMAVLLALIARRPRRRRAPR